MRPGQRELEGLRREPPRAIAGLGKIERAGAQRCLDALTVAGADAGVGYGAPLGGNLSPGLYKLGTFNVAVTGTPVLNFIGVSSNISIPSPVTGFGSSCDASDFANTVTLSIDFTDNCGSAPGTDTKSTTWGKIKQLYH